MGFSNPEEQQLVFLPELMAHTFLFFFSPKFKMSFHKSSLLWWIWQGLEATAHRERNRTPSPARQGKPKINSGLHLGSRQWDWTENRLLDPLCHTILCIPSQELSAPSVSPPPLQTQLILLQILKFPTVWPAFRHSPWGIWQMHLWFARSRSPASWYNRFSYCHHARPQTNIPSSQKKFLESF